jgi:NAD(P)-dependent dehydrogenase (short-subunit alcohol dehydrogenase family)
MVDRALTGRVALITGAAAGIGRASALAMAGAGARVAAADVNDPADTARAIEASGGEAIAVACDISIEDEVRAAVGAAVEAFGRLDILHANAGLGHGQAKLTEIDRERWDRTIAVNLTGTWLCLRYAIRQMLEQGEGGAIVITSSATGTGPSPSLAGYAATKAALINLAKTAAVEFADAGIRTNAVTPGGIATDMVRRAMEENPAFAAQIESAPRHLLGQPEDVAAAAVWLCSPASSHVSGAVLSIDGGLAR